MFRRGAASPERRAFEAVAAEVEGAKGALLSAVPAPRREPPPLAEALLEFHRRLDAAEALIGEWRSGDTGLRARCREALAEASRRGEWLRLEAPDMDFESLVLVLGDLIAPLEVFGEADRAVR